MTKYSARALAEFCAQKCLEKKAENVVILDLAGRSSVADYYVVASGFSDRQVKAVAEHVSDSVKTLGERPRSEEGLQEGKWALIDCSDVIVHVFLDSMRDFYNLEGLWQEAPRIRVLENTSVELGQSLH